MSDRSDWPRHDPLRTVLAGLAYFAVIFAAGVALGTVPVVLLIPRIGETAAVVIELPVILTVAWIASRWLVPSQLLVIAGGLSTLLKGRCEHGAGLRCP